VLSENLQELLKDREIEEYLAHSRNSRIETLGDWKDRIDKADEVIRGNIGYTNPDGVAVSSPMMVMNLADQVPRDIARLTSESEPSYSAPAYGDKLSDEKNAALRGVIGRGYFAANNWDLMRPQLVMDFVITGTFFAVLWVDSASPFPRIMRLDPRSAYPDVYNGELQDVLSIQTMKRRVAQRQFPDVDFGSLEGKRPTDDIEVIDYYGPDFCVKAVGSVALGGNVSAGSLAVVNGWAHGVDKVPAVFQQLPSPDGAFRGMLDQIGSSLGVKNKVVNLIVEQAHQGVYAPWVEKGVSNPNDLPGPDTVYHLERGVADAQFGRVAPSNFNPQLFGVLQYLDTEERGQLAYPTTRQGEVGVSQGSASFVTATQGQLTSVVREASRALARSQEQLANIAFQLDEHHLDFEKPLVRAVEKKNTYIPSRDIQGYHRFNVEYGAGAGLDRLNTDQRLQNWYAAGLIPGKMALEQTDFIADAATAMEDRENEELSRVILQRFSSDPSISLDFVAKVWMRKRTTGVTLVEAYAAELEEQQTAQPELPAQPGAAPVEAQPAAPEGQPGLPTAGTPVQFSPQPLAQYLTRS